jgi:hypothetical protein
MSAMDDWEQRRGARRARVRDEHSLSHASLRRFHEANPGFLHHPMVREVGHHLVTHAQRDDLERAGLSEAFRKRAGRDLTDSEVRDVHLRARAHGHPVRPAHELIEDAAQEIEKRIPELRRHGGRR